MEQSLMKAKKGQTGLAAISPAVIALVVAFFVLGIGAVMLSNFGSQFAANTYGANITNNGLAGLNAIASQGSTLGYVVVLVVVVGLLLGFMAFRNR